MTKKNKGHPVSIYQLQNGALQLKTDLDEDTIWASLMQIAELFDTDKSGISRHIKNIYESSELSRKATVAKFATVQKEGGREIAREIEYFNLDVILSVGGDELYPTIEAKAAISLLKIIRLLMAINVVAHMLLFGFYVKQKF